jgi:hypothetical protein
MRVRPHVSSNCANFAADATSNCDMSGVWRPSRSVVSVIETFRGMFVALLLSGCSSNGVRTLVVKEQNTTSPSGEGLAFGVKNESYFTDTRKASTGVASSRPSSRVPRFIRFTLLPWLYLSSFCPVYRSYCLVTGPVSAPGEPGHSRPLSHREVHMPVVLQGTQQLVCTEPYLWFVLGRRPEERPVNPVRLCLVTRGKCPRLVAVHQLPNE